MLYQIKPEYLEQWGSVATTDNVITDKELERLARSWDKPVSVLLEQVEPMETRITATTRLLQLMREDVNRLYQYHVDKGDTEQADKDLLESRVLDRAIWLLSDDNYFAKCQTIYEGRK